VPFASANMVQLFHQILLREPPEPRKLNERVDGVLNDIVMRAMAKRREDRFASASEMAHALDTWLATADRAVPTTRSSRATLLKVLTAVVVIGLGIAAWFAIRNDGDGTASARRSPSPVVLSTPRTTLALFGDKDRLISERLKDWAPLIGAGTFGTDEDSSGVIGVCRDGISAQPYALPDGNGCVSGYVKPVAPAPGTRTSGAGAGVELSNGRIVALLLVPAADGYDLCVCEMTRDGDSRLVRGSELASRALGSRDGERVPFRLAWNETDTQFEWGGTPANAGSFLIPSAVIPSSVQSDVRPSQFLIIVESGGAGFEELVLEQS
jgi:hypothetical protein